MSKQHTIKSNNTTRQHPPKKTLILFSYQRRLEACSDVGNLALVAKTISETANKTHLFSVTVKKITTKLNKMVRWLAECVQSKSAHSIWRAMSMEQLQNTFGNTKQYNVQIVSFFERKRMKHSVERIYRRSERSRQND